MSTPLRLSSEALAPDEEAAALHAEAVSNLFRDLQILLPPDTLIRRDEPLAKRTTLRVGGPADLLVEPGSDSALALVLETARLRGLPVTVIGRGSNLLVRDGGIRGVVVSLAHPHFSRVEIQGERITAGAGARLKSIAHEARRAGLTGLEFFEGIPGALGGALRMNAGAMGAWTFDAVESLRYMSRAGVISEAPASGIPVEYRACPLLRTHIALGAVLKATPADAETIRTRMDQFSRKRWDSQPSEPSAGCTFKNPLPTVPAGRLIDELGLKGTRIGDAMVSPIHANFFVNLGNATAKDVLTLIEVIRARARDARGLELETEVEILGEDA
jgi:UDP-N-acetylenolpyruvoylglucosamine reductase